jgi:hypothetical protein
LLDFGRADWLKGESVTDQYKEQYTEGTRCFTKSVHCALDFHAKVRNLPLLGVSPSARLMFARIFFLSSSILRLCPISAREEVFSRRYVNATEGEMAYLTTPTKCIPGVLSWLATLLDGAIAAFQKIPAGV